MKTELVWSCDQFRDHLIDISDGKLLPVTEYPDRIQLSSGWRESLAQLRDESTDGLERWSWITRKRPLKLVYLQRSFLVGQENRVDGREIAKLRNRIRQAGMTDFIGGVHSHPVKDLERVKKRFWGLFKRVEKIQHIASTNAMDLYFMVTPHILMSIMGVVEGNESLFAFRTRESVSMALSSEVFNQENFVTYWHMLFPSVSESSLRIAERHKLVFYRGELGDELVKSFTPSLNS